MKNKQLVLINRNTGEIYVGYMTAMSIGLGARERFYSEHYRVYNELHERVINAVIVGTYHKEIHPSSLEIIGDL